ncbi:hypothetical protein JJB09_23800 [Rhizobium sp. KVB221]|uniref:Uncharacterized protein n=1 Tax=Rhizobium setariae TaxID=2801340 RepID=A0A936YQQ9_9HYPH|nr:hypothetical protein [Rhizobium setariae]MBL0375044.1 hypothetical protein [Rhizobium setariae]
MEESRPRSHAVVLHASCSYHGKPCLPGIRLIDSMMEATASLGTVLPEDFGLQASVDIEGCPRRCQLVVSAEGRSASVFCGSEMLAEASSSRAIRYATALPDPSDVARSPLVRHGR